ncbi:MAG: hypothetical protein CMH52_06530 [Myxococcales bacterium]|nr:hypothetical protein [Myxococcales bacterium]
MYWFHIPPDVQLAPECPEVPGCPARQLVLAHQSVPSCQLVLGFSVNLEIDCKDQKSLAASV